MNDSLNESNPESESANSTDEFYSLIRRGRAGDDRAVGQLLTKYRNYLLLIANQDLDQTLKAKIGASDVVQQSMLAAQQNFEQFRGESETEFLGWLRKILVNDMLNTRRQFSTQKRDAGLELNMQEKSDVRRGIVDPHLTPSTEAMKQERALALSEAMNMLSDDHRNVIQLRNFEQLDFEEIGQRMNRSRDAVRKLWARAVESLQSSLATNHPELVLDYLRLTTKMKDKSDKLDRARLASDLEKEYDAIVGHSEEATGNASQGRRLQSVRPALELLNEFRDQPELVQMPNFPQAERETQTSQKTVADSAENEAFAGIAHPKQIGRFGIIEQVGQGGLGVVYRARDPQLNRDVAIKVPLAGALVSPDARDRFVTEAKAAAALAHPQIVTVYESGQIGPVCFLACEFVEGPTLASWFSDCENPLAPDTAAGFIASLADALQHAHSRGVVHRDIKPGNILLDTSSGKLDEKRLRQAAKISDFGLAKLLDEDSAQTCTGSVVGTPAYMAPSRFNPEKKQSVRKPMSMQWV